MKTKIAVLLCILAFSTVCQTPEEDEVFNKDMEDYKHTYYSGYLMISLTESVHYAFFESQDNPAKDPLIMYLGGGPGCSSLSPLFHQNGPFIFLPGDQNLTMNPNAWNKRANMLYFELPAGVGFSQTSNPNRTHNDSETAFQAYTALRQFYNRFPTYRARDLYLTGHAYAAVYHAYLAKLIIEHNEDPFQIADGKIRLKGLLLGNPCVLENQCYSAGSGKRSFYHYEYLYKRAFFTTRDFDHFKGACVLDYDDHDCYLQRQILDKFFTSTNSSSLNIYDKCYKTVNGNVINQGCQDESGVINHLNKQTIKDNWHITGSKAWEICSDHVYDEYLHGTNSFWLMPYLIEKKLRMWIYSGDFDSQVPIVGTKVWINMLKNEHQIPLKKVWREWWIHGQHKGEDQVGGYVWELDGLTFASVRGAGLRSGIDRPKSMEVILNNFMDDTSLPKNPNIDSKQFVTE